MFKLHLLMLATASLSVLSSTRSGAVTLTEDFSTNPSATGWRIWGDTNLFQWDTTNQNLRVTWDSRQTNSYCYQPLGTILAKDDDFSLAFDLRLDDFTSGIDPAKTNSPFQISVGLLRRADATASSFFRGSGSGSPNLIEFSFFPDPGGAWQWGPSLTAILCDRTGTNWSFGSAFDTLTTNDLYRVELVFDATNGVLNVEILRNGQPFVTIPPATLGANFTDFRADILAVCSYSDAGQWPGYEGSILAHGTVDNFNLTLPPPPVQELVGIYTNGVWKASFLTRSNWIYAWEISTDLTNWNQLSPVPFTGTGGKVFLQHLSPPPPKAFYRVWAQRP